MNWRILGIGLALTAPLVWVLASGFGKDPKALPSMMEGRPAPEFSLLDLDGRTVDLASFRGRPVVLNFWATWCGPCLAEHPLLRQASARYRPRGVVFLGVLYGDEPENARAFLQRNGGDWPVLVDPGQRTAIDYGVAGVPETFFIAPDGTITRKVVGPLGGALLVEALEEML